MIRLYVSQYCCRPVVAVLMIGLLSGCDGTTFSSLFSSPTTDSAEDQTVSAAQQALLGSVNDDPEQFLGQEGERISVTLGTPDLVRRDGRAEVRQFRGQACILDLFLYPDTKTQLNGDLKVRHVELRAPSLDTNGRRACMADIIRDRTVAG